MPSTRLLSIDHPINHSSNISIIKHICLSQSTRSKEKKAFKLTAIPSIVLFELSHASKHREPFRKPIESPASPRSLRIITRPNTRSKALIGTIAMSFNIPNTSRAMSVGRETLSGVPDDRSTRNNYDGHARRAGNLSAVTRHARVHSAEESLYTPLTISPYPSSISAGHGDHSLSPSATLTGLSDTHGGYILAPDHSDDVWDCPNPYGGCEYTQNPSWHAHCPICGAAKPS